MKEIILYSTHCPKCRALEILMAKKNVNFLTVDNEDMVVEVGKANGIISAPILQVGDEIFDFSKAVKYINTL